MGKLFPIEIQEYTIQTHWVKRHTTSKKIYLGVLLILLVIIICLPFIYIDVTAQSRGVVRTPYENNSIQSVISGQIVKNELFENKHIIEGDTLIWLNVNDLEEQILKVEQNISDNELFIADIDSLLIGKEAITPKYIRESSQYKTNLLEKKVLLDQSKSEYEISKKLYKTGAESKFDLDKIASTYKSYQTQFNLVKQQQFSVWEAEKTRLELENKDLNSDLQRLRSNEYQYFITAPITGYVVQYTGVKTGNFVSPNQTIAQIVPEAGLIVESFVSPNDIGYIASGQRVKFQIDAFNYQQWGLIDGTVTEIIPDVVQIQESPYFRVRCSLDKDYLQLENGYQGKLKIGMTLTSRFFLTRRSLAQLLFDDINNWLNPKIVDNGNKN